VTKRKTESRRTLARGTFDPSSDDERRGHVGVIVSLVRRPDGTIRLVLDDARASGPGEWKSDYIVTSRDFPAEALREMDLDPQEFEDLGLVVLSRLVAVMNVQEGE